MDNHIVIQTNYLQSLQEDSLYHRGRIEKIAESLALGILFLVSFLANGIICTVLLQSNRRQKVSNIFLLSLVFANFFISVVILPFVISSVIADDWLFGSFWCETSGFLLTWFSTASNLTIVAIAIHRYYIVIKPLALKIDLQKANYIVSFLWFAALSCAVPPLFGWNSYVYSPGKAGCTLYWKSGGSAVVYTMFYVITTFIIPVCIILFGYRAIYVKAKQQRKLQMYVFRGTTQNGFPRSSSSARHSIEHRRCGCLPSCASANNISFHSSHYYNGTPSPILARHAPLARQVSRHSTVIQQRTFQSASAIVTSYVICLSPYFVFNVWISFQQPASPYGIVDFVTTFLYLSMAAVNPMTYGYSNRQTRRAVKRLPLLRRFFKQGRDRTYQMDPSTIYKASRGKRGKRTIPLSQSNEALELEHPQ